MKTIFEHSPWRLLTLASTLPAMGSREINILLFEPMKNNNILSPEEEINHFVGRKPPWISNGCPLTYTHVR